MTKRDFLQFLENTKEPDRLNCPKSCCLAYRFMDWDENQLKEVFLAVAGSDLEVYPQSVLESVIRFLEILQRRQPKWQLCTQNVKMQPLRRGKLGGTKKNESYILSSMFRRFLG